MRRKGVSWANPCLLAVVISFSSWWGVFLPIYLTSTVSRRTAIADGERFLNDPQVLVEQRLSLSYANPTQHQSIPEPLQVMQEYIAQHADNGDSIYPDRKYILLEYACPHRAGNIMSGFLNSLLLGILTNRTVLWHYIKEDDEQLEACSRVLQRADWIPRFDRSSRHKIFKFYQRSQVLDACERLLHVEGRNQYTCMERLRANPSLASKLAFDISEHSIIDVRGISGCIQSDIPGWEGRFDMRLSTCADYLSSSFGSEIDSSRARKLYRYGLDFLYGMLFRYSFSFTPEFMASIETVGGTFDPSAVSVGVHSRHSKEWKDGADVEPQARCLDQIIAKLPSQKKCQILIMSDRQATNDALMEYAKQSGCDGIQVAHDKRNGTDLADTTGVRFSFLRAEHGPFAGTGFYKDMALVTQARHAFVATTRSSSALVQEVMKYDHFMRRWEDSALISSSDDLMICYHEFQGPSPLEGVLMQG